MTSKQVSALIVKQWLPEWEEIEFSPENHRSRPPEQFFLFSLYAHELRQLSGIQRRSTAEGRARSEDLGIQRRHDENRSKEIARYVRHGFPWSSLTEQQRNRDDYADLKMPGWLPTAVVVNIVDVNTSVAQESVALADCIRVHESGDKIANIEIPDTSDSEWELSGLPPIEIIDGTAPSTIF